MRRILLSAIKVLVSGALLYLALRKANFVDLASRIDLASAGWLSLAVAVTFLQIFIGVLRWRIISAECHAPLSIRQAMRYNVIGAFFNQTLPSSIGGDAVRLWLVARAGAGWRAATYSIFVDRAVGLIALAIIIVASLPWSAHLIADSYGRTALTLVDFAALAGAALLSPKAIAQTGAPLITRAIPSSGERIPVVGLGTAYVFDKADEATRRKAGAVVQALIASGGRLIDTASTYGDAEAVLGDVIATEPSSLLVISENARVQGKVMAGHVIINGQVQGPVVATALLELQPKARIVGDVHYEALEMHQGATIDGVMKHSSGGEVDAERPLLKLAAANEG